jgi:dTDP-4-dehydrorhamnose reductase
VKALVLGAEGMLGHVVQLHFKEKGYEVSGTSRTDGADYVFDVMQNVSELKPILDDFAPDAVVNCIGVLNKVAEDDHPLAVMANSYLPHYADELCRAKGIKFVHISTDCVFDGKKGEYTEDSFKDATSFYGQSKSLGEVNNDKNVTLRTSIIGPDKNSYGIGLFQWFMNQEGETNGFDKVVWTGVTTVELAKCIEKAIQHDLTGLRHVVNNEKIDKHNLLTLIKNSFNKAIEIKRKSDYVSDKSLIRTTDFDFEVPSYEQMVDEMADWVTKHESLYSENQRVRR